jgi:hypothetical protein
MALLTEGIVRQAAATELRKPMASALHMLFSQRQRAPT